MELSKLFRRGPILPQSHQEVSRWVDAGLIPEVHLYDSIDDTLAGILKVVREKISEPT